MKFKLTILFILSTIFSSTVFAASFRDSIGVENNNGKKVILHKLDPKDNYYSIGRRYNVKPNLIIQYNNNAALRIGNIIKVPTELPFDQQSTAPGTVVTQQPKTTTVPPVVQENRPVVTQQPQQTTPAATTADQPQTQDYKVSAGETLYAIARRFNVKVEQLIALNKLKSNYLSPGQVIKVPATTAATQPQPAPAQTETVVIEQPTAVRDSTMPVSTDSTTTGVRPNRFGLYEKNERGVATWLDEEGLDPNKKLVLHRTAPIGTVIKITNTMTNRTTFAKVVGRFTDNQATKDVVIVMTKNVAESLGALDKRFHVTLSYGTTNE
ncbi:LysM peptidoglycan-binding domain-containing protein [Mucilaginibacter limnophilus]|uniref:LysM peptidoglycan-binding domain-containing protein n=1 Tax=Mucilaginibacter limnophilus TaxID=1932778 RepID=A0A437MZN5_9SPHI|nr:LysM peptidoglycan-binding domain-containing protein [Mucilaginibacter limnophilus]RVU03076.1 LysM peptidoglycan-binding domain-containing protein [Mucilaginibacter limnophilus]